MAQIGGRDAVCLFGKEFGERIFLQSFQRGDDADGIGFRAGHARVRAGTDDEQRLHFFLPDRVILARDDFVDVEKRRVFGRGRFSAQPA